MKHTAILHPNTEVTLHPRLPALSFDPMLVLTISGLTFLGQDYFETFDGSQYLARPWLRTVYPRCTFTISPIAYLLLPTISPLSQGLARLQPNRFLPSSDPLDLN